MNSLLGGIGNSILNSLGGSGSVSGGLGGTSILLQALGAAMRGESAQSFMNELATTHPQLKKLDLNDLQGTANQLCQQNGLDPNEVAKQIDTIFDPAIKR